MADARPPPADGCLSGQALTAGCINVLVVVTALALLELGEGGVGLLDAAVGLGALLGAVVIVLSCIARG